MSSLSGGERKRLVLNNANRKGVKLRILDEPFTSLDKCSVAAISRSFMPTNNAATIILAPSNCKSAGVL
jgi:ABC-type Mn2+/Zn2+ transport system ATPase subunit